MSTSTPMYRMALAPGLLAAIALFLSPLFPEGTGALVIRYIVAILALIVAWFAAQGRQWWWTIVFAAIAVVWNPVYPFEFEGTVWTFAQFAAAFAFLVAGALIKVAREEER